MSAPRELLDQLDALREATDPHPVLPWHVDPQDDHRIATRLGGGVCSTYLPADAALIVAAVNHLPELTAALRAVLDMHTPIDDGGPNSGICMDCAVSYPCTTVEAITAALSPADPMNIPAPVNQP